MLTYHLKPHDQQPLYEQLYHAVRADIMSGALPGGTRLRANASWRPICASARSPWKPLTVACRPRATRLCAKARLLCAGAACRAGLRAAGAICTAFVADFRL